jgi:hypothetical protein
MYSTNIFKYKGNKVKRKHSKLNTNKFTHSIGFNTWRKDWDKFICGRSKDKMVMEFNNDTYNPVNIIDDIINNYKELNSNIYGKKG